MKIIEQRDICNWAVTSHGQVGVRKSGTGRQGMREVETCCGWAHGMGAVDGWQWMVSGLAEMYGEVR